MTIRNVCAKPLPWIRPSTISEFDTSGVARRLRKAVIGHLVRDDGWP